MDRHLKVLCLHGYRQNTSKFRSQTGALRKILKNHVDFHFISAPNQVPEGERLSDEDERSWWFTKQVSFSSHDVTDNHYGFEDSLQLVENTFVNEGPFDGILGFSQGAALAALLCTLKIKKLISYDFKFVILVSGFKSLSKPHLELFDSSINVPSLHVIGETDKIIAKETSENLATLFTDPKVMKHQGGHFVAHSGPLKQVYLDFILQQKGAS